MYIIFRLYQVKFLEIEQPWWTVPGYLSRVIQSCQQAGLWEWFRYYGKAGTKCPRQLPSVDQLIEESRVWKEGSYIVSADMDYENFHLCLNLSTKYFDLTFLIDGSYLKIYQESLINKFTDLVYLLHNYLQNIALIGPSVNLEIYDVSFKQIHPPRLIRYFGNSSIVNYISKIFFEQYSNFDGEKFTRLLNLPIPEGCIREQRDDLVIFYWAEHLNDQDYVAQRLSVREKWFVEAIDPEIKPGYNSLGDCIVSLPRQRREDEVLTFYDPGSEAGYKTVLVNHDWSFDEELFAEMASWLKAGKLPHGLPLKKLHIILSDRESALFISDRARAIGIEGVYYIGGNDGKLWNPSPNE